jgi:hypothetical protein
MIVPEQYLLNELFQKSPSSISREFSKQIYVQLIQSLRTNHVPLERTTDFTVVPPTDLLSGKFVPDHIARDFARDFASFHGTTEKYTASFAGNTVPMEFFLSGPSTIGVLTELRALLPVIDWMCREASVGVGVGGSDGSDGSGGSGGRVATKPLTVHLYMSDSKKQFPDTAETTIAPTHCNAAVTWACNVSGEVLIYRREEWGKTLLHELFHSLCLDMAESADETEMNAELERLFHLPGKPQFRETYCEWWATILYCAAIALQHGRDTGTMSVGSFHRVFQECVAIERHHSFIQVAKLLRFWRVEWCDFLKHQLCHTVNVDRPKHPIPKEETNVFCYFVLRCVLFQNIGTSLLVMGCGGGSVHLKRTFSVSNMAKHLQNIAYGDDFDITIQSYDRMLQVILSRVHNSRMNDAHKTAIAAHISKTFRMTACSGWMI